METKSPKHKILIFFFFFKFKKILLKTQTEIKNMIDKLAQAHDYHPLISHVRSSKKRVCLYPVEMRIG
jgi:hypothetical protein